jgi:chromosome segregation ATPase
MFMETPETLLYVAIGAFVLGWLVAKLGSAVSNKVRAKRRDPRDDRIRNLDAELRIAQSDVAKSQDEVERKETALTETQQLAADKDTVIAAQKQKIAQLRTDLQESVKKTRELRSELSHRAEENVRSEVKLREVETELSVAQASSEFIATGVLDYSMAPDAETTEESEAPEEPESTAKEQAQAAT